MRNLNAIPKGWVRAGQSEINRDRLGNWRECGRLIEGKDFVWVNPPVGGKVRTSYYNPGSLVRAKKQFEDERVSVVKHGGKLKPWPLAHGITLKGAMCKYRVSIATIWKLIRTGKVAAGLSRKPGRNGFKHTLVSSSHLSRCLSGRQKRGPGNKQLVPKDGVSIATLARETGFDYATIKVWCDWKVHPGLGHQIRSGIGTYIISRHDGVQTQWRGLLASRADVALCADLIRNPFHRPIAANPGEWLAEGIFRHKNGGLYFTERYIHLNRVRFGLPKNATFDHCYRRLLERITVVWPRSRGTAGRWRAIVFSEADLNRLVVRRTGKIDGGDWLIPGELWKDREGLWYSTGTICRELGIDNSRFKVQFRDTGRLTRFKAVTPRAKSGPFAGTLRGRVIVHHESEIRPLLGIDNVSAQTPEAATAGTDGKPASKTKGGRPASMTVAEVYEFCYDRWCTGEKLVTIRLAAARRFGEARAPKEDSHVTLFAQRWMQRVKRDHDVNLPLRPRIA